MKREHVKARHAEGQISATHVIQNPADLGGHFRKETTGICRLCGAETLRYPSAAADRTA